MEKGTPLGYQVSVKSMEDHARHLAQGNIWTLRLHHLAARMGTCPWRILGGAQEAAQISQGACVLLRRNTGQDGCKGQQGRQLQEHLARQGGGYFVRTQLRTLHGLATSTLISCMSLSLCCVRMTISSPPVWNCTTVAPAWDER